MSDNFPILPASPSYDGVETTGSLTEIFPYVSYNPYALYNPYAVYELAPAPNPLLTNTGDVRMCSSCHQESYLDVLNPNRGVQNQSFADYLSQASPAEIDLIMEQGHPLLFSEAVTKIEAKLQETSGDVIDLEDFSLTRSQAQELVEALKQASLGDFSGLSEWDAENSNIFATNPDFHLVAIQVGIALLAALASVIGFFLLQKYLPESIEKNDTLAPNLIATRSNNDHVTAARTEEIKETLYYFARGLERDDWTQLGLLHGKDENEIASLNLAIADTLRLGAYPDGTPVEAWILEKFDEVRIFDLVEFQSTHGFVGDTEAALQAIAAYQEAHPKCLLIIGGKGLAMEGPAASRQIFALVHALRGTIKRPILVEMSSEGASNFREAIDDQLARHITPVLNNGSWTEGLQPLPSAVAIVDDLVQFYATNTDATAVRSQAKMRYEQLKMKYKIGAPGADPQAALLFAQVETTYNKILADVHLTFLNINEYAFKLMVLNTYAQYMRDPELQTESYDIELVQSLFASTLRNQAAEYVTAKQRAQSQDAQSEFSTNLAAFANIMAENLVALSQQFGGRH